MFILVTKFKTTYYYNTIHITKNTVYIGIIVIAINTTIKLICILVNCNKLNYNNILINLI